MSTAETSTITLGWALRSLSVQAAWFFQRKVSNSDVLNIVEADVVPLSWRLRFCLVPRIQTRVAAWRCTDSSLVSAVWRRAGLTATRSGSHLAAMDVIAILNIHALPLFSIHAAAVVVVALFLVLAVDAT
jgi:hypothetical protein